MKEIFLLQTVVAAGVCSIGLSGCSAQIVVPQPISVMPSYSAIRPSEYHAYGDSITYGATLADPAVQAYPTLIAGYEQVPFLNYAISGDQVCDIAVRQIFANNDSPQLASLTAYSLLIGTNDVKVKGLGSYENVFQTCHLAASSWLALPAEAKVLATSSTVVTNGPGAIDRTNNWNSWTTAAPGASVSFPITLPQTGPVYAWVRIDDTSSATYAYMLDGVVQGSGSVQTTPAIATLDGSSNSLAFLRLAPVPAGAHIVTFTQTSLNQRGVSVVGVGSPVGLTSANLPVVFVGYIPYQHNTGRCTNPSYTICQDYSDIVISDANLLSGDGLKIRYFDPRWYLKGTSSEMNDRFHPNVRGQQELAKALEAVW